MALDFDKYCLVDGSPTTVLPASRHRSGVAGRKSSGKPKYRNGTASLTEQLEIDFGPDDYCSGSCRDFRSQGVSREGSEVLKRESVYQSSKEVRLSYNTGAGVGRRKIELSPGTASSFSLGIIDSLCSSDEEGSPFKQNRSSLISLSEQSMSSAYTGAIEFCSDDSAITLASVPAAIEEKDQAFSLHRSLSATLALPRSPARSDCYSSRVSSPKARFSPIKKMIDPFVKHKPRRSPLSNFNETHGEPISGPSGISRNKAARRSLQGDILEKPHHVEYNHQNEEKENHTSVPQCSPAHLHGLLKMGKKHGVPYFEFSVKSPEDVYVAKTWRVKNASTWVYTFHLLPHRRKRSTSGWEFKEFNSELFMVGKMYVSCQQYTEFKGSVQLNDYMVTEFVLHDMLHSRKSTASQDNTSCNGDTDQFGSLEAAKLRPELENAAIIMQESLEKRESLKFKAGYKKIDETTPDLLYTSSPGMMHVVIPAGSHSFPIGGSCGPSPLLNRWRSGGGCDCGGWDMACPLNIFTNKIVEGQPLIDNQSLTDLFVQGRKDNIPAFSMRVVEDGKYAVDFHAQLSSLQAFSVCVAILHAAETSPVKQMKIKPMPQSNLLKVYSEEEIKNVQDAIADEEKFKTNKMEEPMPSFIVNPTFSPIARV